MLKILLASIIMAFNTQSTPETLPTGQISNSSQNNFIYSQNYSFKESSLLNVQNIPTHNQNMISPVLQTQSALAIDGSSAAILFEKNAHTQMPIASITKLMTAIIILENHNLDEVVTIGPNPPNTPGVKIWLAENEKITVSNLLRGLLIPSGNDAALALAEFDAGSESNFVRKMNEKAHLLGLKQTNFINSTGLDESSQNLSSAYELGLISIYALKQPFLRETVQIKQLEIQGENFGKHLLENTNQLLGGEMGIIGLKTGNTDAAGPSFVSLSKTTSGSDLITVILNSPERFTETNILIDWVRRAYVW